MTDSQKKIKKIIKELKNNLTKTEKEQLDKLEKMNPVELLNYFKTKLPDMDIEKIKFLLN